MTRSTRKTVKPPQKSVDTLRRESNGSLPAFFARQSSQSAYSSSQPDPSQERVMLGAKSAVASKPVPAPKTKKGDAPPPADKEVITISSSSEATHISISSDSPSHISISSDSVAPNPRTRSSITSSSKGLPGSQSLLMPRGAPTASVPGRSVPRFPLPPLPTPRLRTSSASKPKLPLKRPLEDSSDGEPEIPQIPQNQMRVPRTLPVSSKGLFPMSKSTSAPRSKPLAPKDNVLPSPTANGLSRTHTSPKRVRLTPPGDPAMNSLSSGNDADTGELIPSSQSDEQELSPPKIAMKDPVEVKGTVDKWRKETLPTPPSPEHYTPPYENEGLPQDGLVCAEDDIARPVIPMDVDASMGPLSGDVTRSTSSAPESVLDIPFSEAEVSAQLRGRSLESTLSSYLTATSSKTLSTATSPSRAVFRPESPPLFPSTDAHRSLTPPRTSDPAPLPVTPVALDTESKTAKIIAEIKAKAYAETISSPDEEPIEFKELEDSSDESEDEFMVQLNKLDKGKGKVPIQPVTGKPGPFSSPLSNLDSPPQSRRVSGRYNLRHHSPSAASNYRIESRLPSLFAGDNASTKRKPFRKVNPLEALLKEKTLADKRGKGMDALRAAEAAIASSSKVKDELRVEMDDEEQDPAWADENAALLVVQEGARGLKLRSSSPLPMDTSDESDDGSDSEEMMLEEGEYEKFLGEEGGEKVKKILAQDRGKKNIKRKGKKKDLVLGVPFWDDPETTPQEDMQVDGLPPFPIGENDIDNHPLLLILRNAVDEGDVSEVVALLNSNLLVCLAPQQLTQLLPWLFNLAMFPSSKPFSEPAYQTLLHVCTCTTLPAPCAGFSFPLVSDSLFYLGARASVVKTMGWNHESAQHRKAAPSDRAETLYRLVSLVTTFVRRRAVAEYEIPNFILSLLLVALDASTSITLRRNIMTAIEALVRTIPLDASDIEIAVCSKIVAFARGLTPINRSLLLSYMPTGCAQTIRIVRWIARCLLLGTDPPGQDSYSQLPSLLPILELLSPPAGSEALFDVQGNSEKDDYYDNLSCHLGVLSKVLTSIDEYVALEREVSKEDAAAVRVTTSVHDSASKTKEKPPTLLEQVRHRLDALHGKIIDTRAVHLDRSRAKATLQRLSFRVYYQQLAGSRSGPGTGKPRNLHGYFGQPRK